MMTLKLGLAAGLVSSIFAAIVATGIDVYAADYWTAFGDVGWALLLAGLLKLLLVATRRPI